jgi:DNA repair protein RadD
MGCRPVNDLGWDLAAACQPAACGPVSAGPQLRPYQTAIIADVRAKVAAGMRRLLLPLPTAAGKTVIAAAIVAEYVEAGKRVLILVHRRELTQQMAAKLHAVGVDPGIVQSGFTARPGQPVQVASIPTLHARAVRSSTIELPPADLVIVDEAHHARARTYRRILESYPDAAILGLTATPCRSDGRGLGDVFDGLVVCPSVADLTAAGYLVPTRVFAPSRPDLTGVRIDHGDYAEAQLAERMDTGKLVGDIVTHWLKLARGRRTVIFATGVAHSRHLTDELCRAGVYAAHIDGDTPVDERDAILAKLAAGIIEVVVNAQVLVEGWDSPSVSCLVLARPTRHMGLYRQMVGRVLRPASGKTDALILDHAGAIFEHGFIDEPLTWALAPDKRAENPTQISRAQNRLPALTTCPECKAVRIGGKPCSACGWRPQPKGQAVDVTDGDLGEVDRGRKIQKQSVTAADKLSFYRQLLWIARNKGYKPGWAAHKHKEKFGTWPPRNNVPPLSPEPTTLSWIRSRQIAYAKAREAAA